MPVFQRRSQAHGHKGPALHSVSEGCKSWRPTQLWFSFWSPGHSAGSPLSHQTVRFEGDIHSTPPILTGKNGSRDGALAGARGSKSCPRPGRPQAWGVKLSLSRARTPAA